MTLDTNVDVAGADRRLALLVAAMLAASVPGGAASVYRLGGDGNPWTAALSDEPGALNVLTEDGTASARKLLSPRTYATWQETLTTVVDSVGGLWLRPFHVPDTLNLARNGVRDRIPHGRFDNLALTGSCNVMGAYLFRVRQMFDGDPSTASYFPVGVLKTFDARDGDPYGLPEQLALAQATIVDLGADYPVNRVRFFPRLGRENPRLASLLDGMSRPRPREEDLGEQDFTANYLPWFEVSGASGDVGVEWCTSGQDWFGQIQRYIVGTRIDSRLDVLASERANPNPIVEVKFPSRPLRFIGLRPIDRQRDYEVAELEVFGSGHAERAVYRTAILDLGEDMTLGELRWWGRRPRGTEVILRTRSGDDDDPLRYWVTGLIPGQWAETTRQAYLRADPTHRRVTDDQLNWSGWTSPYEWDDGLSAGVALHDWPVSTPILSPSPARFLQVQIQLLADAGRGAAVRNLDIRLSRPAAHGVVAEIWPVDVEAGERTTFTYSVRPMLLEGDPGFDRLEIFTLMRVDSVRSVTVDRIELGTEAARVEADRLVVDLPLLRGDEDTAKLVQVVFDARVVRYGTEFRSWVYDSGGQLVRQLTKAGDAEPAWPGNEVAVRTSLTEGPLARVRAVPSVLTPNGDGANDRAEFHFDLYDITGGRALRVELFSLGGARVRRLPTAVVRLGVYGPVKPAPAWDGRDDAGRLVPPGSYVFRLSVDTDDGEAVATGTVGVAY